MLDILRLDEVEIDLELETGSQSCVKDARQKSYSAIANDFLCVRARVTNHTGEFILAFNSPCSC